MRILVVSCLYAAFLMFSAEFCVADDRRVEVVGVGECADCAQTKFKTSQAFSGLQVSIDCKAVNGKMKTRGIARFDGTGSFRAKLPAEIVRKGRLTEDCYAQVHSAKKAAPCPAYIGSSESLKIVFKSKNKEKLTYGLSGKLKFSSSTCTSAFFWPHWHFPKNIFPHFPPFFYPSPTPTPDEPPPQALTPTESQPFLPDPPPPPSEVSQPSLPNTPPPSQVLTPPQPQTSPPPASIYNAPPKAPMALPPPLQTPQNSPLMPTPSPIYKKPSPPSVFTPQAPTARKPHDYVPLPPIPPKIFLPAPPKSPHH